MQTIAGLVQWIEPHIAHFVAVFLITLAGTQVVFGGQAFDVTTQHGALAFVVALGAALFRAFEDSGSVPAGTPGA